MRAVISRMIYDTSTGQHLARATTGERVESLYVSPNFSFFVHRMDRQEGERILALDRDRDVLDWLERNQVDPACVAGYIDAPLA